MVAGSILSCRVVEEERLKKEQKRLRLRIEDCKSNEERNKKRLAKLNPLIK